MLIIKASSLDRSNSSEVQEFNKLLNEYKNSLLGKNVPAGKPEDLDKQFKKVQSDLLNKNMIGRLRIDNVTTDKEIPATDVKTFYKKLTGE
jgi:hypothetical protein